MQVVYGKRSREEMQSRCIRLRAVSAGNYHRTGIAGPFAYWTHFCAQVQLAHDAVRPVTYMFRDRFSDFLKQTEGLPDLNQLQEEGGIRRVQRTCVTCCVTSRLRIPILTFIHSRLVVADRQDPHDVGFVQFRASFYIVKDLDNFMLLLDQFFVKLDVQMSKEKNFDVEIFHASGISADKCWESLVYENWACHDASAKLPCGIFEVSSASACS